MAQTPTSTPSTAIPLAELPLTPEEVERTSLVDFDIDRDSPLPVGVQLDWKIRGMLVRGALRPGDQLPSVRGLAEFAEVNVNTARATYRGLEQEELISSEQGRGTFVTAAAADLRELEGTASRAVAEAREQGLDPKLIAAAIYSDPSGSGAPAPIEPFPEIDPSIGEAKLRGALRQQIARLEAEIATYAWHDQRTPAPKPPSNRIVAGRPLGVDELAETRSELIDRLRRLRGEAAKRGEHNEAARNHVAEMLADPDSHRWEMVTSADTGDTGCKNWRVVPTWGPVGAIMGWWRVKVSSGCPLAAPLAAVTEQATHQGVESWSDQ